MLKNFKIEQANPSHFSAVTSIWNPIIRDTLWTFNDKEKSPKDVETMISERNKNGHLSIVGVSDGKVVGFASYTQFRPGTGYKKTMEHTVIIDQKFRGCGLGKRLVAELEKDAVSKEVNCLIAGVSESNPAGLSFHKSIGFNKLCILPNIGFKFGKFLNLILMQKKLSG